MTRIINLTEQPVRVFLDAECVKARTFMPSGKVVHFKPEVETYKVGEIDGISMTRTQYKMHPIIDAKGISEELYFETPGVYYLVPSSVAKALPHRKDFLTPAEPVFDPEDNCIIGYRSLGTIA